METKYVRVPFEVGLAKKITNGECDGRIVTRDGRNARIICWDKKPGSEYNIVALLYENETELIFTYTVNGFEVVDTESDNDLFLEIPEYMTFKDGDVIAFGNFDDALNIAIFEKRRAETNHKGYVSLGYYSGSLTYDYDGFTLNNARFATEEEKQKLIDALKANREPKAKEYLKRFFPNHSNSSNIGKNCEFKPFDKVLVRDNGGLWFCSLFSHISKKQDRYKYITVTGSFENCIPYNDKTAHLLGTTENYE